MGFRTSRLIALLALLGLIATACAGGTGSTNAGDAPAAVPFDEESDDATTTTAPQLDRLVIAARNDINASPLWIADSEGFFEANGIEVQFLPVTDASDLAGSLLANRAQVVVDSSSTAIRRVAGVGAGISLISYLESTTLSTSTGRGTMSLVASLDDGITTLNNDGEQELEWEGCSLVGKVIGVDSFVSLQAIALREMLAQSECSDTPVFEDGIRAGTSTLIPDADESSESDTDQGSDTDTDQDSDNDTDQDSDVEQDAALAPENIVQFVELDAVSLKLALKTDGSDPSIQRVDAGVFAEPNTTRLLRENESDDAVAKVGVVANLDRQLCNSFARRCASTVVVANNTWLERSPDVARRFNDSVAEAINWISRNDVDYRAALVSCCAISPSDASDIPTPNFVGASGDLAADLEQIVNVLERLGKIDEGSVSLEAIVRQDLIDG